MLKISKGRLASVLSIGKEEGFTLIELMVAAALSLVVMGGIYSVYQSQQKSYLVREQTTAMQQNLRAGMVVMTSDIRMAGYVHPNIRGLLNPADKLGITEVNLDADSVKNDESIKFTLLKNKDDDPDTTDPDVNKLETIKYYLFDKDGDGDLDLVKDWEFNGVSNTEQLVAENIDALDFVYLDKNGAVIADPPSNLTAIRSVQVTMIAKTGRGDQGYKNTNSYKNQQNTEILPAQNDGFRRRKLSREIKCRNL